MKSSRHSLRGTDCAAADDREAKHDGRSVFVVYKDSRRGPGSTTPCRHSARIGAHWIYGELIVVGMA